MAFDTAQVLRSLPEGSELDSGVPFKGLDGAERIKFKLTKKKPETEVYQFELSVFGVYLTKMVAKIGQDDKVLWQEVA